MVGLSDDVKSAYELVKDLEPAIPQEYILKAVVFCLLGQQTLSVPSPSLSLLASLAQCPPFLAPQKQRGEWSEERKVSYGLA